MEQGTTAVVNCGELVTLRGPRRARHGAELRELGIERDRAIFVRDGRIARVGSYAEIRKLMTADTTVIDAAGRLVTPGFVDAHTHLVFAGTRENEFEQRIAGKTYGEIAAAGGGILSTVAKTRAASDTALLATTREHLAWCVRGGTTTLEAKSGYGLTLDDELRILEILSTLADQGPVRIVPTLLAAHTVPPEFKDDRAGYVRLIVEEILPRVKERGLARYCDAFCDDHAFTVDETRVILRAAQQHGLGLRLHADQFRAGAGVQVAAELGAATADHLECMDADGIAMLKRAEVQPVLLPASVFALSRMQYPDARGIIEAGLPVVLATDFNPGSSPTSSMPLVMSLACLEMRMLPSESLTASTINAAYSLGLGDRVGSLEEGKDADFLLHAFRDYREIAYFVGVPQALRVFIRGIEAIV
ncbi:MAG: imidazolonepropionase [Acidobacteriaceae bacterium]